jgi:hypothetical protein
MQKRRPRRIAADEAHAWARNLRLGNPLAKLVLCMLALYVNGEGECFVSINQLADDTELDRKTVMARLGWLEKSGLVRRHMQWCDASGVRNSEGRGRRTSDLIVLCIGEENSTPGPSGPSGPPDGPQRSAPGTTNADEWSASGPLVVHLGGPQYEPEPEPEEERERESARAREPLISEAATKLASECLIALGLEPEHPPDGWYGLAYDCEVLIKRGCDPPVVLAAFAQFKGRNPLPHKNYVLKAVQSAHQNPSGSYAKTAQHPGENQSWHARRDRQHAALAKLGDFVESTKRDGGGGG